MDRVRGLLRWFGTLFRKNRFEGELDEELRFHIELEIEENIRQGMPPAKARQAALRDFGGIERTRGQVREAGTVVALETLLQDLRYALRRMVKKPGFTIIAVLMMALGIGANTTIYSAVYKILFEPLPYEDPDRIYRIWGRNDEQGWLYSSISQPNYIDLRNGITAFEEIGAYTFSSGVLTGQGDPVQLRVGLASESLFHLLGIQPTIGRNFLPEEDADGIEPQVVLLTDELWRTSFGEDPGIVGESIILNGRPLTVVGVLPPGEHWLEWYDLYLPLTPDPANSRGNNILWAFGRLKPDVSIDQAQAHTDALALRIKEEYPENNSMTGVTLRRLDRYLIGSETRTSLLVLIAAVGFVLLIACSNLANMLLAQATGRRRELAISSALGAGRGRLIRQMLTESSLLTLLGGVLGILFALWMVGTLKALDPGGIPRLSLVAVNGWVCAFTFAVTILVGILTGLIPALQTPPQNVSEALQEGGRMSPGRRQHRVRSTLVVVEMALSVALLVGAGLMIRSLLALQRVDRGFNTENRLLFDMSLPESPYEDREQLTQFLDRFLTGIEAIPVVEAVGAVSAAPIEGLNTNMAILAEGQGRGEEEGMPLADWRYVTPGYFQAMGLPLLQGRTFEDLGQQEAAPYVDFEGDQYQFNVVINEGLAQELWPDENPIGKKAILWNRTNYMGSVIGVVGDMRERGLEYGPTDVVYLSYAIGLWNPVSFIIHTSVEPTSVIATVRRILSEIDPNLPVSNIRTFDEILTNSFATRRFNTSLLLLFAAIALALVCAGIYGVTAYSITERSSELAVRVVLGARPAEVLRFVISQGMKWAMLGVVIGLASAVGLSQVMRNILYGVVPLDALTYAAVAVVLTITAFLSNCVPALRVMRVDPISTLREE